jgi:hypothetical protein
MTSSRSLTKRSSTKTDYRPVTGSQGRESLPVALPTKSRAAGGYERHLADRRRGRRVEVVHEPSNRVPLRSGTVGHGDDSCMLGRFSEVEHADL